MAGQVVEQKLESLRRCLARVRSKCPETAEALASDVDAQDIVAVNLTRAVQLCVDVGTHVLATRDVTPPDTMGETFDRLAESGLLATDLTARMKRAVGSRNIVVQNYGAIDWQIVHAIGTKHLGDFEAFAKAALVARDH